jgi:hypothetical protein
VTDELDEGPIIEQDVARISHRDQIGELIQKGRDLEKVVLSRAVRWHIQHRILMYASKDRCIRLRNYWLWYDTSSHSFNGCRLYIRVLYFCRKFI